MTISIENFRTIAQTDTHRVLVGQQGTSIVKARETWGTRLVAWVKRLQNKAPDAAKESNRASFDRFRAALKANYGENISSSIDRLDLQHH